MAKQSLGTDVLTAAQQRIAAIFDDFPRIYVSFSGGKDSSVMLHLVMEEAIKRKRKVGVLFVDLEAQYRMTIQYVRSEFDRYADHIKPYWVSLPLRLRNAVSQFEPQWICWEPGREADWVRKPDSLSITDPYHFPFFRHAVEFEEFVPAFGEWYAQDKLCACFVGIRSDESLNRYRTIATRRKSTFEGRQWMTWVGDHVYNVYPIYDWKTEDIWTYNGRFRASYNPLYDRMHQAGLSIHQARICQPYGDDQRKGLWLFHVIEPETWERVVARVSGANFGAAQAHKTGPAFGRGGVRKPNAITWQDFSDMLLNSLPPPIRAHYADKINVYRRWWEGRGYPRGLPDDGAGPSWRKVTAALVKGDYGVKTLGVGTIKSDAYLAIQKRRLRCAA